MTGSIPSPCRNVCRLGPDHLCDGCGRSLGEVARWIAMSADERDQVMVRTATWVVRPGPDSNEPRR